MILILIVSLVSCQETEKTLSVSVTELGEKVEEKMASETVADYDATLLLDDLGIASSLYTEYFYKVGSSDASVEEVAFFKAADEESATTIMQKLQSRKASTESTQKDYNAEKIAVKALYHDASEVITGDMPTPIKYFNPQIKSSYKEIEKIADEKLLSMLPQELQQDYRSVFFGVDAAEEKIIKAADKICAYLKCAEEERSGNGEFRLAAQNTLQAVEEYYFLPEVKYFMYNFAESFKLTLDELE